MCKSINKKWAIQILLFLSDGKKKNYTTIKDDRKIPPTTLTVRLGELVSYGYIEKFVHGSSRKPHHTYYKITKLGLDSINSIINLNKL